MAEIPAILNSKVLIATFMKRRKAWDVSSGRCPEIRDQSRAVINDVTCEERMRVGEVVVDTDHAVILVGVALVRRDQVSGSVTVIRSIRRKKEREKLLYPRTDWDGNATARVGFPARSRIAGRGQ